MISFPNKGKSSTQKKKLFVEVADDNVLNSSLSCEFTSDGIRFLRANIKVTKTGMVKITGDGMLPLSVVSSEDIEFGAELGRGAAGLVQEGIYKPTNFPVAVKTINAYDKGKRHQIMNDLKMFLQDRLDTVKGKEAELSNYLVQVYGAYYDEGSIKIIMELMDAGSLRDVLNMCLKTKKGPPYIEEPYLANIAYQMLLGLEFIHTKKKQIHRDIKPENVLMNSLGCVKLSDFGISKQLEQTNVLSKTFVGTAHYMSPERLAADSYTFPSDIWSLGIILIEMATGEFPYKKTNKYVEMYQEMISQPEPNLPNNGLYSDNFRDFISKCLNKDPNKRATATDLTSHPWLLENSELGLDLSEWITSMLFSCKYPVSFNGSLTNIDIKQHEVPHDNLEYIEENIEENIEEEQQQNGYEQNYNQNGIYNQNYNMYQNNNGNNNYGGNNYNQGYNNNNFGFGNNFQNNVFNTNGNSGNNSLTKNKVGIDLES